MSNQEQVRGPASWRRTTLGEALPIRYGKARNENYGTVREDTPVYGSSGVIDNFNRTLTNGPTLIIGRKGTVGATYYCPVPCWPIDTVFFAEAPIDKDLHFFKYLLDHLQLWRMDRSTAVPGLSRDDYNATEVFVPEVDEQRSIVAEIEKQFSRLDEAVASLKCVKANLKRYKAAVLKAAVEGKLTEEWRNQHPDVEPASKLLERILAERRAKWNGKEKYKEPSAPEITDLPSLPKGWTWARLEQLGSTFGGLTKNPKRARLRNQLPYLRVANVYANELRLDEIARIGVQESELDKLLLRKGDLLVVEGNGSKDQIGRLAVWDGSIDPCVHQNHVIKVRLEEPTMGKWVLHMLISPIGRDFIEQVASSTSGLYTLSVNKVGDLPVIVPPLAEQQLIVAEVERHLSVIEELETVVEANLKRADRLRPAVLMNAFSGQLVRKTSRY